MIDYIFTTRGRPLHNNPLYCELPNKNLFSVGFIVRCKCGNMFKLQNIIYYYPNTDIPFTEERRWMFLYNELNENDEINKKRFKNKKEN